MMRYIAATDIGGTFTDLAFYDARTRTLTLNKLLTTPDDPRRAVIEGLRAFKGQSEIVVHGTTLVTNALIERRGVPTGVISTAGFRDVLEIGTELRYDPFDLQIERAPPLVARRYRKTVVERIGSNGEVVVPLDEAGVRAAARELKESGVHSIAIAFFNSYRNPAHEQRAKELILEEWSDVSICTSSEIAPEIREYERFSTCVANAYIAPIATQYLSNLERSLGVSLFVMLSDGGITTARAASEQPIALVESGPAAGAMGAAFLAKQAGWDNVIAFDMGGTTAKVSLVHRGLPHRTHELEAARMKRFKKGSGLPLRIPVVELIEIGAGGGSIASVDELGLLAVGPRSAGANPGPACYGLGGTSPTVTDADLVRGYLSPDRFLGRRMRLDRRLAEEAIETLGKQLSLELVETAAGIARVVDNSMATAARVHIAEAGTDPLKYKIVAFGGAGPVHAYEIARLLNVTEVIFPLGAGVASAIGMLVAPRSVEFTRSLVSGVDAMNWKAIKSIVAELEERGRSILMEGEVAAADIETEISADMRYAGQGFEITVPLSGKIVKLQDGAALRKTFVSQYAGRFGRSLGQLPIECVSWRVRVVAAPSVGNIKLERGHEQSGAPEIETRFAYFEELGRYVDTPVYARARLKHGARVRGPALIEEDESTSVVGPSGSIVVDKNGNLIMKIKHSKPKA
jgi:N-methylhydantoinase A